VATRIADCRGLYEHRFDDHARREKDAVWSVVVKSYLQRWIDPDDCVLDVGCGFGEFLNHVRCRRRIGVDVDPQAEQALLPGIEFHRTGATDLSMIADGTVNLVFTSNVMEHLPAKSDVEEMVEQVRRVLVPGGSFVALGPNIRIVPGAYWDFWDHLVPISDRSLAELLETRGFRVVRCYPRFLPYTTRSALPKARWLVQLYLRMPFVWRFFGAQFLMRARKQ